MIAPTEYLERHNKVGKYIHWQICKSKDIPVSDNWYEHIPDPVMENEQTSILWDFTIHTDRKIKANRPDIIIKDKLKKTCLLIDVAVPADKNISIKEFEKISKYKDLEIEIQRMWKMKTNTIPIVIGALGLVSKQLKDKAESIPGKINVSELQKITLMGTAHILRKTLMMS